MTGSGELGYAALSPVARIDALARLRTQRARLDAREQRLLHAIASDPAEQNDLDQQWVREDVACALRIPPATAQDRINTAITLVDHLPATLIELDAGRITMTHARRLVDAVAFLPDLVAAKVEADVLPRAAQQTAAQFGASVRRAVLAADPRTAEQRHTDALAERRVVITPREDGMAELWALLPAPQAAAIRDAIQQAADLLRPRGADNTLRAMILDPGSARIDGDSDPRSADQLRADALVELVLGETAAGLHPDVQVVVALSTLLGLDEQPGELAGHGPIPASLVRALAADPTGTWWRLVTDPTGQVLDAGYRSYRPPAALDRYIRLRDQTCRFAGCRRNATRSDVDHLIPWPDGPTNRDNLHALCRRHHRMKHKAGWHPTRQPDGTTHWRSPTSHHYRQPAPELPTDTTMSGNSGAAPPF